MVKEFEEVAFDPACVYLLHFNSRAIILRVCQLLVVLSTMFCIPSKLIRLEETAHTKQNQSLKC